MKSLLLIMGAVLGVSCATTGRPETWRVVSYDALAKEVAASGDKDLWEYIGSSPTHHYVRRTVYAAVALRPGRQLTIRREELPLISEAEAFTYSASPRSGARVIFTRHDPATGRFTQSVDAGLIDHADLLPAPRE